MPWQLIYTSAARGLNPGQSGFCTVARSGDLREALIPRLEQISVYNHLAISARGVGANPIISAYRIVDLRGDKYHVLSRIVDAGLDFTNRTNHLAHHLVFEPEEISRMPSPALIFLHWAGWRVEWRERPRLLDEADWSNLFALPRVTLLPAKTWERTTGDAGSAAGLIEGELATGGYILGSPGGENELLQLFAESLELLPAHGADANYRWAWTFTTVLQGEDQVPDLMWRGCWPNSPAFQAARRGGARVWVPAHVQAPASALAQIARIGSPEELHPLSPDALADDNALADTSSGGSRDAPDTSETSADPWDDDNGSWTTASPSRNNLFVAATLVALAVAGALIWNAWRGERRPSRPGPSAAAGTLSRTAGSATPLPPPTGAAATPRMPRNDEKPPPALLAAMAAPDLPPLIDALPTYVIVSANARDATLSPIPELEELWKKIRHEPAAHPLRDVECLVSSGGTELALTGSPTTATLILDGAGQTLRGEAGTGVRFQIHFGGGGNAPGATVLQDIDWPTLASVTIVFRPVGAGTFAPFRLLALAQDFQPTALRLSRAYLRNDGTNLWSTFEPALRQRLQLRLGSPGIRFSLSPYLQNDVGTEVEVFHRQWPTAHRPPDGMELNFTRLAAQLRDVIGDRTRQSVDMAGQIATLRQRLQGADTEFALGRYLALPEASRNYSFSRYSQDHRMTNEQERFVAYLFSALRGSGLDAVLIGLHKPAQRTNTLAQIERSLRELPEPAAAHEVPTNYFLTRWHLIGLPEEVQRRERQQRQLDDELQSLRDRLQLLSTQTPKRVSLYATDGSRRIELLRFVDSPERP